MFVVYSLNHLRQLHESAIVGGLENNVLELSHDILIVYFSNIFKTLTIEDQS
jgi:hypothetical protein